MLSLKESTPAAFISQPGTSGARREMGGKAGALAALHSAHLPIPPWFVISPATFRASLADTQHPAFEAACAASDLPAIERILAALQFPVYVRAEIERAVAALCPNGERVAVRSSALDEDGIRHSFAGQMEPFLFIAREQVGERVCAVWRGGLNARVLAYRREHHLSILPEPPAVLVQQMVDAETAGVAFSADPVSGRRGLAVVSALYGLGTALVSGECDADTYNVGRSGDI